MTTETIRVGARTEALILLPAALLLLVCLSFFTLFSYRSLIERQLVERGQEADRLARSIASAMRPGAVPSPETLRRLAPPAWAVALLDASAVPFVVAGDLISPAAPAPRPEMQTWTRWVLPASSPANVVSGFAAVSSAGRASRVRVDLPALGLRGKARSLRIVWPLILGTNLAMVALLMLYLRRWLVPFDRLVARARRALPAEQHDADEIEILLGTFDRALAVLEERPPGASPGAAIGASTGDGDELGAFQRALSRSLESGVLLCDRQGTVLALNEIGSSLLGLPALASERVPLAEALDGQPALRDLLVDAITHERAVHRHEQTIDVAGETRTLGLTVHPLRRDDGAVRGFLTLFADLTVVQRKAEQRRLAENLTQVGTLAAGVAHEMRNGLATLRGYFGLIERGPDDETLRDYLHEMRREGDHLQRVLDDFLRFARPGSLRKESVDLLLLARRCAADPGLEGAPVTVAANDELAASSSVLLEADPQLLEQALRNLLRNAVDAQAEAGVDTPLVVRLARTSAAWIVSVDDHGCGLAPDVAANLFDPFVTGRAGGVGLGLALAQRIVLLHGGSLSLEARDSGGTRAIIRLPQTEPAEA